MAEQKSALRQYLLSGNSLKSLTENPYNIKIKRHVKYPNLVMFKYSQLNSDFSKKLVKEARGIILDENDNWKVVSFPYIKFFNHGEKYAAKIDWGTTRVYEKLDGSLMVLYYYDGAWHISSSGVPDASGYVNDSLSFKDLFWETWNDVMKYNLPKDRTKCYIFELMTPHNQVVVYHQTSKIVLHGVRCILTLKEEDPAIYAKENNWNLVSSFDFADIPSVLEAANKIKPREMEGYILCDSQYNRLKIKNAEYVKLSYIKTNIIKPADLITVVQKNEGDEVLVAFPHLKPEYDLLKNKYDAICSEIYAAWEDNKQYAHDSKEFANKIKNLWYKPCLFGLRTGKIKDVRTWMSELSKKDLQPKLQ